MCLGAIDEFLGGVLSGIVIVVLPIIGIVRLGKYLFYDLPRSFWKKKEGKQVTPARQEEIPQPPTLHIIIPVSEDPC